MALDPAAIQIDDAAPVRAGADDLLGSVRSVADRAATVRSAWQALAGAYHAPEQSLVLAAMDTPATSAQDLAAKTATAHAALHAFADRLDQLRAQRATLVADTAEFEQYKADRTDDWGIKDLLGIEGMDLLNREEDLLGRCNQLQADLDAAQRDCANALNGIWGGPSYEAADRASVTDRNIGNGSEETEFVLSPEDAATILWEPNPTFGHWDSIARLERDQPA